MNIEECTEYVEKINERIHEILKDDEEALDFYSRLVVSLNATCEENKRQKETIDKVIEIIEPLTEFDMCTSNGKILKKPLEILKGESE